MPDTAARLNAAIGGGGVVRGGEAGRVTGESSLSALLQPRLADPSLRPEGEFNPRLENKSCPLAPFSDEDDCGRPLPVRNCGAIGDIERRFRGTMRLVNVSDSQSDWLSWRRLIAAADAGGVIDDSESPLICGPGVDLVSKEDELSKSGLGAGFGEGLEGVGDTNPARDEIESLMMLASVEGVSSPDSGGVGAGRTPLLGCGSMLSRGGRK